jgi:hypothetical protein
MSDSYMFPNTIDPVYNLVLTSWSARMIKFNCTLTAFELAHLRLIFGINYEIDADEGRKILLDWRENIMDIEAIKKQYESI